MVSTRRSGDAIEDLNALTLRSRTIDVDLRHPNDSHTSHDHGEHVTARKGRKVRKVSDNSANNKKSTPSGEEALHEVLSPNENAGEEPSSSVGSIAVPSSASVVEEGTTNVEVAISSKQLGTAPPLPVHGSPLVVADGVHGVHKRFRSDDHESVTNTGPVSPDPNAEDDPAKAQVEACIPSENVSDDEGAPEIFRTNVRQSLPFTAAAKARKYKKPKPRTSATLDVDHEDSACTSVSQVKTSNGNNDNQLSLTVSKAPTPSKWQLKADRPGSKRVKDITKDGITYRTVSAEALQGQTSPWLPAKASPESRKLKERLLVRKRVQDFNIGPRRKFIISSQDLRIGKALQNPGL